MNDWVCVVRTEADRVSNHSRAASSSYLDSLDHWMPSRGGWMAIYTG